MEPILSLKNITKRYPGVVALDNYSMDFLPGEVHALLGENGAGKSTLIKTISGAIVPDEGEIIFKGETFQSMTPALAKEKKIEVIYQEFNLIDTLSAAENICLGEKYGKLVDFKAMEKKAAEIFAQFKINIDPKATVESLSTAQKQIVEISKAISRQCDLLIMDEPSAPLTVHEVDIMFDIVRTLKKQGITIIYISHRMDEIFTIADRVTVMRDGTFVKTLNVKDTNREELIRLMVGRELSQSYPEPENTFQEELLRVESLYGNGDQDISFSLRKGEILGVAGLIGAGRTELARVLYGADPKESGRIFMEGREVKIRNTSDAIRQGIGLIPEDRKIQGCFLEMSIEWNIAANTIREMSNGLIVDEARIKKTASEYQKTLRIKTPDLEQLVQKHWQPNPG
jgi:ribose transport system ATP-binding protein